MAGAHTAWAIVLAAGASSRMGRPKALLEAGDGRSFVRAIVDAARAGGCVGVVAVLAAPHEAAIGPALPADVMRVHNDAPERGMLSSVQAGLRALPATASAALVWPVDVPLVQPATVRALVDAIAAGAPLALPTHGGRGGHPLALARETFAAALALPLDDGRGLRALVERYAAAAVRLPVDDGGVCVDFDAPGDLARLPRSPRS